MSLRSMWLVCLLTISMSVISAEQMVGVNLAGAEFNNKKIPGRYAFDYIWPTADEISRYSSAGFTVIRVPFLWERLQPELNGPLQSSEVKYLDTVIDAAQKNNVRIVIDPHNYGSYKGSLIGSDLVTVDHFQDFWRRVADRYKNYPNVIFGLMNEPHKQSADEWAKVAQAAIDAIRATGANQLILVPGTRWTGAHSWISSGNADAMRNIQDPQYNYAFDMHQYFDSDSSGTHASCVSESIGVKRLEAATAWLNANGQKAFLGEFGASVDPTCLSTLDNTLNFLKENHNVWIGWTYWASGAWFSQYMFNINSLDETVSKQFQIIKPYLN